VKPRDDFRLGQPAAIGPALDHVCPICSGEGDTISVGCYCGGLGVITAAQAASFAADDPAPEWQPQPLPPVPVFTGKPCSDCAFRPDSLERDGKSGAELYQQLALGNRGEPFWCHQGMHHGARGSVPRQRDARGAPIGHPICAGWLAQYRRSLP
jgi:hypothetical protein